VIRINSYLSSPHTRSPTQIRRNLNLNRHRADRETLHSHDRQDGLVLQAVLPQVSDNVPRFLRLHRNDVAADFVDLRPPLSTGFVKGVLDVVEGRVNLKPEICWDVRGEAVPSAWCSLIWGLKIEVEEWEEWLGGLGLIDCNI